MTSTLVLCPSCGAENLGTRFCESCGTPAPSLAPVQPTTVRVTALATPPEGPVRDRGPLFAVALRTLAIGPVTIVLLPAIAGSILALLGGLGEYGYYPGFAPNGTSTFSRALELAWPLTLILAILTATAGVVAGLTSDKTTGAKVGAIALAVIGTALITLGTVGWTVGGAALASAWIALAGLRGWSYYALLIPVATGFVANFAISAANTHILVGALVMGLLAAATVAGVVLLGRSLSAAHARQPPKPPPAPRPVAAPGPGYATGQVLQVQLADGQIVPVATGVVAGYGPGYLLPQQRTNGFAIAALVLGLLSGTILPIIFGHVALSQIRRTGERGAGMATVGLVFGYLWTIGLIIYLIWVFTTAARFFW
jgi:hypothetical protein